MKYRMMGLALLAAVATAQAQDDALDALFAEPAAEEPEASAAQPEAQPDAESAEPGQPAMPSAGDLTTIEVEPIRPQAQPPAAAGDEEPRQIEEIVVTAQKTKQSLQKVPISVTAVGGEFIAETGSADLADVALYVPNVRVDADDLGSPQMFIRGFGTNAFNPSFEGSVGFVQDEIFYGRPGYFTESMFDIDRVEVLRGPQGTLFGKNTIAGVFNVSTVEPEGELSFNGRASYGDHNAQRIEAGVGGDLGDWGGGRIAGLYRREDGELYNQFLDRDEEKLEQKAGRVRLRWYPTVSLRTELLLQASDTHAAFWPYQLMLLDDDSTNYLDNFDQNIEDDPYNFLTSFDTPGYIDKGHDTVALNTQWQMGEVGGIHDLTSTLVVGYSTFFIDQLNELDVSPADIARLDNHEDHKQLSAELRFNGSADSLFGLGGDVEFVAGAFYYQSDYTLLARILAGADLGSYALTNDAAQLIVCPDLDTCFDNPTLPLPILGLLTSLIIRDDYYQYDYTQDVQAMSLFGQMTWFLNDQWAITPGLRLNRETKDVTTAGNAHCPYKALLDDCVMGLLLESSNYTSQPLSRTENDVSPKLTIQYFADDDVSFYTSYARGFKSGGYNSLSLTGEDLEFEPEKAQTVELGMKSQFFDRTLRVNATLYATKFDNLQVLAFNGFFFDVSNAAAAKSKGLEADFLWLTPWAPLTLMGSVGLLEAKYDEYASAPAPVYNPQTGELQLGKTQDLGGERIAFAPRATATFTPVLSFPIWRLSGKLAGDVIYQGDQYTDTDLDENTHVDAYTLYSARFILSDTMERWSLTIGGTNLGDERVLNQVTDATFFPGTYFAQQASGRQVFAAVTVKF